ncbi:DUF3592 domain-containing protein [Cellulomonas cellasea]|uniref:DUF3592 domain-containing protein n=2 Tax=Cellulomonas cellasea TaxID=43670 RepID=A0A0A0B7W6_9CELL|nr:DUF3592 domain-containing protein [Cellulomonas cellasea]KGM01884.1 hypothetical protein Q760_16595 [Cellulomonas cellasea DSM 20118]GEA86221.1 hypothetical protein CCE01nite_01700 [Cellulomonas cellasea]
MSGARVLLLGLVVVVFVVACLAVFAWRISRHRAFTRGLRGTAVVVEVRPMTLLQRKSVTERPTEFVTVATAEVPRGVQVSQKIPAGSYAVGQVVPVVQHPRDPHRLYLDRPDLEPNALVVYLPLVAALMAPVTLAIAVTRAGAGA